jgi:predicted dehydrogenase
VTVTVTSPRALRWAVFGYGDVVTRRVLPALADSGQPVTGIWGRRAEWAELVAQEFGVPCGTDSIDSALDDAEAVYVATPVAAHLRQAVAAARAGKHVLIEKPLRGGLREDDETVAALEELAAFARSGLRIGVAYYRRLAPAVRGLVAEAGARPSRDLSARVGFGSLFDPGPEDPMRWRTESEVSGGGVLADAGCHRLDLLCLMFGRPERVTAEFGDRFPGGAERRASLRIAWAHGAEAHGEFAWLRGTETSTAPEDFFALGWPGGGVRLDPLDRGALEFEDGEVLALPPEPNQHRALVSDFARAVALGRAPVCPLADASLVDEVLRAAAAAAARGEPVML